MPNWCYNRLIVHGDKANEFNRRFNIASKNTDTPLVAEYCLRSIVPVPDDVDDTAEWSRKNWGVARDVYGDVIMKRIAKEQFHYKFMTAWSPPYEWLQTVSQMFSDLKFKLEYAIPMNESGGEYIFDKGNLAKEQFDMCCAAMNRLARIRGRHKKTLIMN